MVAARGGGIDKRLLAGLGRNDAKRGGLAIRAATAARSSPAATGRSLDLEAGFEQVAPIPSRRIDVDDRRGIAERLVEIDC